MSTAKTIHIVFYKGPGTIAEHLIRLWTKSPYSHSEFGRSDGLYHSNDRFRFVSRTEMINIHPNEWEICKLTLPVEIINRVEKRQLKKNGTKYDWMGIVFSQVFRLGLHDSRRWFCSKSNADDLYYAYALMQRSHNIAYNAYLRVLEPISKIEPHNLSPRNLFEIVQAMETIQQSSMLQYPLKVSEASEALF